MSLKKHKHNIISLLLEEAQEDKRNIPWYTILNLISKFKEIELNYDRMNIKIIKINY